MFDMESAPVGVLAGDADTASAWCDEGFDDLVYQITVDELNTGWVDDERHVLPDLESIPPGPFLAVVLEAIDRSKLNGYDLVRLMGARERQGSHVQAEGMADMVEISHAAPGDAVSEPERMGEAFEFASDEIRAALTLTRRSAKYRLSFASDLMERLPEVWRLFTRGVLDLPRVRVIASGTAHLDEEEARRVADLVSERAPRLTTGQLAAWIRRLCVESDPKKAKQRRAQALEERRFVVEPTEGVSDPLCKGGGLT